MSGLLCVDAEQSRQNVDDWYELHHTRQREIGIRPLPKTIFVTALSELVPKDKGRFFFVRLSETGEMVAGALFIYHGRVMDVLIASGCSEYARLRSNYLLPLHAMRWARSRGLRYFNWQASPPDSGVYRYKLGWGSVDLPYCYLTRAIGDVAPFLNASVVEIKSMYPWHYVLPFDRLGQGGLPRGHQSTRAEAWHAAEASQ